MHLSYISDNVFKYRGQHKKGVGVIKIIWALSCLTKIMTIKTF